MNKRIENILIFNEDNSRKLERLKQIEDEVNQLKEEIDVAKRIISGEYIYCEKCKDYYLAESFITKQETEPVVICTYEGWNSSNENEYAEGHANIIYRICPKGHKYELDRKEIVDKRI